MRVWTIDRDTFEVLGWTSVLPEHEGDDNIGLQRSALHRFALLPNGDLLRGRVRKGVQRLISRGVS